MGRRRGPKFFFPIPGRKSSSKIDKSCDDLHHMPSPPSISLMPSASEMHPRYDGSSNVSKAHRLLGTAPPPFRTMTGQTSVPPSPGYMSITVSDAGSDLEDRSSSVATEKGGFKLPYRPSLSNRASSSILPANVPYNGDESRESNCSSISRHLHPATSNSTMRSHYDATNSPLAISQQTSDSAVRDMALRKGKPQIGPYAHNHMPSPLGHEVAEDDRREHRKSKPPRLDLSKLFPKPNGLGGQGYAKALLSPNKLVNSPTPMSTVSDRFPRPMTREPTPAPNEHAKLTNPAQRHQASPTHSARPTSPIRSHTRDKYDNAKVHVRRPPRGIKHWFEGLSEDSDEGDEEAHTPVPATTPYQPSGPPQAPIRKSSRGALQEAAKPRPQPSRASQHLSDPRKPQNIHANPPLAHRLNSPSSFSVQSQSSLGTTRTKESAFSKNNLQDSSVLSFSSSEDEGENEKGNNHSLRHKVPVRDSLDMYEDHGDIVIGQAQAYVVRPQLHSRRPSVGKLSLMSTSTNAATIEVMYTPEPPHTPATRYSSSSRRVSHSRQPSVIHEVEDKRPKTARLRSQSPSSVSVRTSKSEPRSQEEIRKFMAVTPEEEALLEALRKKRAAMAQQSWVEGYVTAIKQEEVRQQTPPEQSKKHHRTSAFLSTGTPSSSPVQIVDTMQKPGRKSPVSDPLPLRGSPRGRKNATRDSTVGSSILRDSSSCDPTSDRPASIFGHLTSRPLLSPPEFSPLDLFPSSNPTAGMASPTTTTTTVDHPASLPSPVTPHLRHGEDDVDVKVASSEPSWNGDSDEVAVPETGFVDAPSGSIKPEERQSNHHRRRTASSGTAVPLSLPAKCQPTECRDLTPVTETSSRPTSAVDPLPAQPKLPNKSSLRSHSLSISTTGLSKSKHSSIVSTRTTSPNRSLHDRVSSRRVSRNGSLASMNSIASMKRESVAVGTASTRCSVSEDVLAAWGSLGGMREYETARW